MFKKIGKKLSDWYYGRFRVWFMVNFVLSLFSMLLFSVVTGFVVSFFFGVDLYKVIAVTFTLILGFPFFSVKFVNLLPCDQYCDYEKELTEREKRKGERDAS